LKNIAKINLNTILTMLKEKLILLFSIKGRVHCFSVQVVMNKCFLRNPEKKKKKLAQIRLVVFEKNAHTSPSRRLGYSKTS